MLAFATGKEKSHAKTVFRRLARAVDSPFAKALLQMTDKQLSEVSITPSDYLNASAFSADYMLSKLLSKYIGLVTSVDTKAKALEGFEASEVKCSETNRRIRKRIPSIVDPVIHRACRLIANLLGPIPDCRDHDTGRWGPGATYEFSRSEAYLDTKISKAPFSVTTAAAPFFLEAIEQDPHWKAILLDDNPGKTLPDLLQVVNGSRMDTVPKDAKTDRTIAVEPRGNMFLQKSVGSFFRSRLKRVGVDLDDQGINQSLAFEANLLRLATLDLKSASDSISLELVYELLPFDWAYYLDCIRSKQYTMDGKTFKRFEKFSSMGNGFTFELESLIFWALSAAVCEDIAAKPFRPVGVRLCAVYGDDIIVPQEKAWELTCVLNWCGFDINLSKSFYEGNFYESCGRHYFDSVDVTPIYQKKSITSEFEGIRFYNRLRRWQQRNRFLLDDPLIQNLNKVFDTLFRAVCDFQLGIPVLPYGFDGDRGFMLDPLLYSKYKIDVSRVCPNRGTRFLARANRPSAIPCDERAHYAYKLREISGRIPDLTIGILTSSAFLKGKEGFDGNVDSRQETSQPTRNEWAWYHTT